MDEAPLYTAPPVLLWAAVVGRSPAIRRRPNDPIPAMATVANHLLPQRVTAQDESRKGP